MTSRPPALSATTSKPPAIRAGRGSTSMPELSEEGKEKVRQMQAAYDDDRQTAVLPGTGGTITGVAINEWLDDDGNPKFGKDEQRKAQVPRRRRRGRGHGQDARRGLRKPDGWTRQKPRDESAHA